MEAETDPALARCEICGFVLEEPTRIVRSA